MAYRSCSQSKVRPGFKKAIKGQEIEELKRSVNFLDNYIIKFSEEKGLEYQVKKKVENNTIFK